MADPDSALDALKQIIQEFKAFVAGKGSVSEADTRAKLIDRILVQVCGWPEGAIVREEHEFRGTQHNHPGSNVPFCSWNFFWAKKQLTRVTLPAREVWDRTNQGGARLGDGIRQQFSAVPSFVPTTKPYGVLRIVAASLESLAGQGICSNP